MVKCNHNWLHAICIPASMMVILEALLPPTYSYWNKCVYALDIIIKQREIAVYSLWCCSWVCQNSNSPNFLTNNEQQQWTCSTSELSHSLIIVYLSQGKEAESNSYLFCVCNRSFFPKLPEFIVCKCSQGVYNSAHSQVQPNRNKQSCFLLREILSRLFYSRIYKAFITNFKFSFCVTLAFWFFY